MEKSKKQYIKYIMLLPTKLEVEVYRADEGGFWARVKNLPGCVTQGNDFLELIEMVNDAVFVYFDIPIKFRQFLGYYIPLEIKRKLDNQDRHKQIEEEVRKIILRHKTLRFSKIT